MIKIITIYFFFNFYICSTNPTTENKIKKTEIINFDIFGKKDTELITNAAAIIIGWSSEIISENDFNFFKNITKNLECGKQIKTTYYKNTHKKLLFQELEKNNIQFHIVFDIKDNKIIWKLYNVFEKNFIRGKSYEYINSPKKLLTRTILIDIWKELFGDDITPFECFLVFLNTTSSQNEYLTVINFMHPFLSDFDKQLLKTKNNILDLTVIHSKPTESIIFIIQKNTYMEIVKLNSLGKLNTIARTKSTITSPTANEAGLFYIENKSLYRWYFNKDKKKYIKEKIDTHNDYASIHSIMQENKILASRNKKIYEIEYELLPNNEIKILYAKKITENNFNSLNMTYDSHDKIIIVSQKINSFYQLVIYDNNNKKIILTESPYHKQDPVMSPCGNYIAYIAQKNSGERQIEIINRYSGDTIKVTSYSGEYRFPTWIIR